MVLAQWEQWERMAASVGGIGPEGGQRMLRVWQDNSPNEQPNKSPNAQPYVQSRLRPRSGEVRERGDVHVSCVLHAARGAQL